MIQPVSISATNHFNIMIVMQNSYIFIRPIKQKTLFATTELLLCKQGINYSSNLTQTHSDSSTASSTYHASWHQSRASHASPTQYLRDLHLPRTPANRRHDVA